MSATTSNPRKRARSPQSESGNNTLPTRDDLYYMDEGDCFIQVENTVFKLPRYLLTRGSSVFRDMFSLPQDEKAVAQSLSENDPLVLQDTVGDFRSLCWIFTAPPQEIVDQEDASRIDIRKMVSILHLSNKYQFLEYEKWVMALLERHCTREEKSGSFRNTQRCSILQYKRLLTLACLKGNSKIRTHICNAWIVRLRQITTLSSKDALDFANSLSLRDFQGQIYYNEIQRMKSKPLANSTAICLYENDWDPSQALCLYRGYRSLSIFWDRLLSGPLLVPDTGSDHVFGTPNHHHQQCGNDWQRIWKGHVRNLQPLPGQHAYGDPLILNPLESLQALSKFPQNPSAGCRCVRSSFVEQAKEIHARLSKTLADHFLGPLEIETA